MAAAIRFSEEQPKAAARKTSETMLEAVNPVTPETIGNSADLTGSNNMQTSDLGIFDNSNRKGCYIHYGAREHGMTVAMNGLATQGGVRSYGGTFPAFFVGMDEFGASAPASDLYAHFGITAEALAEKVHALL